jgi:REP element-mobilizing transposase RayT
MSKTYTSIWIHAIWTTKERVALLDRSFRVDICSYIRENARENQMHVDTVNGIEDHLHALISMLPTQSVAQIMKQIKGTSSHWINENELTNVKFSWQRSYGALSVSPQEVDKIRKYIRKQEDHHKNWKLDEEFKRFKHFDDTPHNMNIKP